MFYLAMHNPRRLINSLVLFCGLTFSAGLLAEEVTLNFSDADLTAVVNSVSQMTGKNFIIDPRVKGKVTVISSKPLNEDEVYNVFLSILQVHGFSTVPTKNAIKIIPDAAAKQDSAPVVRSLSSQSGDQLVTKVVQINNVNATQLVPILRPLVAQQGHLAAYAQTNVLIVSDRASNISRISQIIAQVDKKTEAEIEFIQLEHAFASEVVRLLTTLSAANPAQKKASSPAVKFSADERTNSILISGEKNQRLKYRSIIAELDQPVESSGNIHVVYLRYAEAENLAKILGSVGKDVLKSQSKSASAGAGGKAGASSSVLNIQADEVSNALVITAPMTIFRSLRTVIQQLDIPRAQVHIEAIIAEVSIDTSNELGVQWAIDGRAGDNPALITNFAGSGAPLTSLVTGAGIGDGLTLGIGETGDPDLDWVAIIRALSGDSDSNLLSTPSIVTLDNQEAEIVVGQNVPFVTGEFSSTTTSGSTSGVSNPFRTIERQDVGISLKVKPQINEGNTISMEIQQEVSNISGSSTGAVDLITNKRSLNTTVQLVDGELLVLGGLIDDELIEVQQKVPGLGDIPILGALFRAKSVQKRKRNLLVFIRANIIKDMEKARLLSHSKYNFMREVQLQQTDKHDSENPVLQDLQTLQTILE